MKFENYTFSSPFQKRKLKELLKKVNGVKIRKTLYIFLHSDLSYTCTLHGRNCQIKQARRKTESNKLTPYVTFSGKKHSIYFLAIIVCFRLKKSIWPAIQLNVYDFLTY